MKKKLSSEFIWGLAWVIFGAIYFVLLGLVILGKQVVGFLKSGDWEGYSVIDLFQDTVMLENVKVWAANPDQLYGLHNVLDFLNGGGTYIVVGVVLIYNVVNWMKKLK